MSEWYYLIALSISLGGLATIDRKYKLAWWYDARRTALTLGAAIVLFVAWDLVGIAAGIFYSGNSAYSLPLRLLPEFPPEELLFLALLAYTPLLMYRGGQRGYRHLRRR